MHIRHDSTSAASAYRSGQEGNDFKNEVAPLAGEIVVLKQTNSAFIGTDLERSLRAAGDACFTFARPDFRGKMRSAEEVHSMSLANLDGEYCRVVNTSEVLASQLPQCMKLRSPKQPLRTGAFGTRLERRAAGVR
jgi:hypothetical protein